MHDLRRQALESKKTVSRKAQSKQTSRDSSRGASRTTSRNQSRNASRNPSDDEEGALSDGTSWSFNSIDDALATEEIDSPTEGWRADLGDIIEQILDRKRSSGTGREETLATFNRMAMAKYINEEIGDQTEDLYGALLKSVKMKSSEKEASLALKALALITITDPSDMAYDATRQSLKEVISDFPSATVKSSAIHTLGAIAFYGGASPEEILGAMDFLLEIIESDGSSAGALDSGVVVTAALEEWGFLATQVEDLEQESSEAMEVFIDQLESSEPSVTIAAGENIALLFEKSFTEREEDENSDEDDEAEDGDPRDTPKMIKRYDPCRNINHLKHQLSTLASISSRRLSKKDKKSLHTNFADILNSVQNPTRGPRYQNALNQETGKRYGSRLVVRIHQTGVMKIDAWWKLLRLRALRRILGGGFMTHYEKNEVVFESLP
ncbi:MAG: hypothetical protein M1823_006211 [Watsoniomyces obsoletus]|nr:MAG: hypothetical protein M1823_006211 [Watsoniomyces obsoletus]